MTVRDAVKVLRTAKSIYLVAGPMRVNADLRDPLCTEAFGDYKVDYISAVDDGVCEIGIECVMVKEEV